uniref:Uncharacterized protein n=1 Tax=Trypanosoma congolense (strain IL3000) TaxID=1068625 RepID=G0UZ80_TRYCI|nr:hypothetical protein, unlikely [Trypanosoma congolense IL3000]
MPCVSIEWVHIRGQHPPQYGSLLLVFRIIGRANVVTVWLFLFVVTFPCDLCSCDLVLSDSHTLGGPFGLDEVRHGGRDEGIDVSFDFLKGMRKSDHCVAGDLSVLLLCGFD